ncbi:MAG: DUF4293 family protein [Bacteroidota bacterium]
MIQRIQSFFLFDLALAALLFIIADGGISTGKGVSQNTESVYSITAQNSHYLETSISNQSLMAAFIICGIFALSIIFLFKKPALQLRLVFVNYFIIGFCLFLIYFTQSSVQNAFQKISESNMSTWLLLPVSMLIFNYLAYRSIKKDLNLLSSADRLR